MTFKPLLAYMRNDFKSKWKTKENWHLPEQPNYRQRQPNEIILETDYEQPKTNKQVIEHTSKILQNKKITHKPGS